MAVEVVRVALWQKLAVCSIGCETSRHRPTGRPASLVMSCPERSDLLPFLRCATAGGFGLGPVGRFPGTTP